MDKPRPTSSYIYTGDTADTFAFKNNANDIATYSAGASDNYDIKVSLDNNPEHIKYYNININPTKSSHVSSKLSNIDWSTEAPSGYTWADDYVAGSNVTISGDNITGVIP